MKRLKSALWWLRTWARTFKDRPGQVEVSQLATTREILAREIETKAATEGNAILEGNALSFAADFERQAALELCQFVKARAKDISESFQLADVRKWEPLARKIFWEFEDEFDPNALDSAIGGLRSMAQAMRLEATR